MTHRPRNFLRTGRLRALAAALSILAPIAAISACERYARVPPSDWDEVEQTVTDEWEIETKDALYRVNSFTTTDSTIVIVDAQWKQSKTLYSRYPENSVPRIVNPEVPIVLPREDVLNVSHRELSKSRTALAIGGTTAVALAVGYFLVMLAAGASIPSD